VGASWSMRGLRNPGGAGVVRSLVVAAAAAASACGPGASGATSSPHATPDAAPPPGMRLIAGGRFTMGTDDPASMANERPAHPVEVKAFFLDEHDVTNAEFREFVEATGYTTTAERPVDWEELKKQVPPGTPKPDDAKLMPGSLVFTPPDHAVDLRDLAGWWTWTTGANWRHPQGPQSGMDGKDEFPVVQVSWDDAVAYANWAGKRLPTEAEWEFAARGGREGTRYVWGDEFKKDGKFMANTFTGEFPHRNTAEDGFARSSPVTAFPPNGYGLYDMAGNVWNWCSDLYADDAHVVAKAQGVCCDPAGPAATRSASDPLSVQHVIKGGSFLCNPSYCESYRPTARRGTPSDTGSEHVGFRCAKDAGTADRR
jgi:sulfatase modifying factor 1